MIPVRVSGVGGLGNRIFQYLFCARLKEIVPEVEIFNVALPEFGIEIPEHRLTTGYLSLSHTHKVDLAEVAWLLRSGAYSGLSMKAYVQRMAYYHGLSDAPSLLPAVHAPDIQPVGADTLVINVRGSEVLGDVHPDYGPVPVDFFSQVAERTGLNPVIVGQLGDDNYSREILSRFAGCEVRESTSPIHDFETIRSATHVAFGVSTFSWLAVWLSHNVQSAHFPVSGIFNPLQRPDIDLLPLGDGRYTFYDLPQESWTASSAQLAHLTAIGPEIRVHTEESLQKMRRDAAHRSTQSTSADSVTEIGLLRRERDRLLRKLREAAISSEDGN